MRNTVIVLLALALAACGGGKQQNNRPKAPDNARLFVQYEWGNVFGGAPLEKPDGKPDDRQSYKRDKYSEVTVVRRPALDKAQSLRLTASQTAGQVVELHLEAELFRNPNSPARLSWLGQTGDLSPVSAALFSGQRRLVRMNFANGTVTVLAQNGAAEQQIGQYQANVKHHIVIDFDPARGALHAGFEQVGGEGGGKDFELPLQAIPGTATYKLQFHLPGPATADGLYTYVVDNVVLLEL